MKNDNPQPANAALLMKGTNMSQPAGAGSARHTAASRNGSATENTPIVARNAEPTSALGSRGRRSATKAARSSVTS